MKKTIIVLGALLFVGLFATWLFSRRADQEATSAEPSPQGEPNALASAEPPELKPVQKKPTERTSLGEHASANVDAEQPAEGEDEPDKSDWGINEYNMERLGRYEEMFLENPTRGASRLLLMQSIAIIMNAQGRAVTPQQGVRYSTPTNDGTRFGFSFNNWNLEFGPGEFPAYEKALPMWEQGGRSLRDGEKLIEIDEDLRFRILDQAIEARILLEAQLR